MLRIPVFLFGLILFSMTQLGGEPIENAGMDGFSRPAFVSDTVDGGFLSLPGGDTTLTICSNDGVPDSIHVVVINDTGPGQQWIISDEDGEIIALPEAPPFDLEGTGEGVCLIWNMRYSGVLSGDTTGGALSDMTGCFDLSNPVEVTKAIGVTAGGVLTTLAGDTTLTICAGDGIPDTFHVTLTGAEGANTAWIITDPSGHILMFPPPPPFDLEGAGPGICQIWNLSFEAGLSGVMIGNNIADVQGCFSLSNPITVTRNGVNGGLLLLPDGSDILTICSGDGQPDSVAFSLFGDTGPNAAWIITDTTGEIQAIPGAPPFDVDGPENETRLVWHMRYVPGIAGLDPGSTLHDLEGCFDLSNPVTVLALTGNPSGGMLTTSDGDTSITICAGDGLPDPFDVLITGTAGDQFTWVVTDTTGLIQDLPDGPPFDFDGTGDGESRLWALSYTDGLQGLATGQNVQGLQGCFAFSNPIEIRKNGVAGGQLTTTTGGTEYALCAGDGVPDSLDVLLANASGARSAWVITDMFGFIEDLPGNPPFDLEQSGGGISQIWHLSYEAGLTGAEIGNAVTALQGCFDLSNPITVTKTGVDGGALFTSDGDTLVQICDGDDVPDLLDVALMDAEGPLSGWIATDTAGVITDILPPPPFDLETIGAGDLHIWHVRYDGSADGLIIGNDIDDLTGCFNLSNPVEIMKDVVRGGVLTTSDGDTTRSICTADGVADTIDIALSNPLGDSVAWVLTDASGQILALPASPPFDLEGTGAGVGLIRHLRYTGSLTGLEVGNNTSAIQGCFAFSTPITVFRDTTGPLCVTATSDHVHPVQRILLHPNPAREILTIQMRDRDIRPLYIQVLDSHGRPVTQEQIISQKTYTLHVGDWTPGIYFIRMWREDFVDTKRCIIVR